MLMILMVNRSSVTYLHCHSVKTVYIKTYCLRNLLYVYSSHDSRGREQCSKAVQYVNEQMKLSQKLDTIPSAIYRKQLHHMLLNFHQRPTSNVFLYVNMLFSYSPIYALFILYLAVLIQINVLR